jgi:NADPH:quinone reductase-like Zn-dependent oxidoreductase
MALLRGSLAMKHLVLTQFGTPSESVALHDDRDPVPGPGDVLVRMEAAAVNPSDVLLLRGLYLAPSGHHRHNSPTHRPSADQDTGLQ